MSLRLRAPGILLLGTCSLVALAVAQSSSDRKLRDLLPGAWRLVSIETIKPNGEVIYPFYGKHPEGILVYDRVDG